MADVRDTNCDANPHGTDHLWARHGISDDEICMFCKVLSIRTWVESDWESYEYG